MLAYLLDSALMAYGQYIPYHPGRWRITDYLERYAAPNWNGPRMAVRHGIRFEVDPHCWVGRQILYNHDHESYATRYILSAVHPGDVAVDAGAHLGWFTLLLSRTAGPNGAVHAFEPTGESRARLLRNIELNHASNVRVHASAIGEKPGTIAIRVIDDNEAKNQVQFGAGEVPVVTLDSLKLDRLDFIKADIEGCEAKMLRGAAGTIGRFRPKMLLELNPGTLAAFGDTAESLLTMLRGWRYRIFTTTWHGLSELRRIPVAPEYTNIVAEP